MAEGNVSKSRNCRRGSGSSFIKARSFDKLGQMSVGKLGFVRLNWTGTARRRMLHSDSPPRWEIVMSLTPGLINELTQSGSASAYGRTVSQLATQALYCPPDGIMQADCSG